MLVPVGMNARSSLKSRMLMMLLLVLGSSFMLPQVHAVDCGKWYSNPCLAAEDIRYDPDASDSLKDQALVWNKLEGFYSGTFFNYDEEGLPILDYEFYDPAVDFLPDRAYAKPAQLFANWTFDGSRLIQHWIYILPPASEEFCNLTVPEGKLNVAPGGTCGKTGFASYTDVFGTSSYERDGSGVLLPFTGDEEVEQSSPGAAEMGRL